MSLVQLTQNNFFMNSGNLCINDDSVLLVVFTSKKWEPHNAFLHQYSTLPSKISGMNFGFCDLSEHLSVAQQSINTSTPIKDVPNFILYIKGKPFAKYQGDWSINGIIEFIKDITPKIKQRVSQQQMTNTQQRSRMQLPTNQNNQTNQQHGTPEDEFTIAPETGVKIFKTSYGRPFNTVSDKDFLEYESAYNNVN